MAEDGGRPAHLWPSQTASVALTMNPAGAVFPPMMPPPPPDPDTHAGTHVCTIHPPSLPRAFDVPFPERRLPVCDRCKKNFKSRDLCRKRDGHKALPWQSTYVAVTITGSALVEGEDGALSYADVPVVAELQETPLMCLGPSDGSMRFEPICMVCRENNYTRDHCRNKCGHTTPPWNTTYVKLVADQTPKDDHKYKYPKKRKKKQEEHANGKPRPDPENPDEDANGDGDVLAEIHKSRTFLMMVSSKKITVRWCERIQYPEAVEPEESAGAAAVPYHSAAPPPGVPPHYSAMQHNSQLWDAFRAGAMWAQSQAAYGYAPAPYGGPPPAPFFAPPGGPAGGHAPGGHAPGGHTPGGHAPGGHAQGGHAPGGHAPGGHAPGGHGGHAPGGHAPGEHAPGTHAPAPDARAPLLKAPPESGGSPEEGEGGSEADDPHDDDRSHESV